VNSRLRFRPRVFELADVEPASALAALSAHSRPVLLDSARGEPSRFSLLAFDPLATEADAPHTPSIGALRALHARLEAADGDVVPGPFHGGLLGALAYDLGVAGERAVEVAPEPWGAPLAAAGLYVDFLVRDEHARRTWLVLGDEPGDGRASVASRRERILAELAAPPLASACEAGELVRWTAPAEHRARIERCREFIAQGDIYQANLAHRFTCGADGAPHAWYARLRRVNPAPYMGFLEWRGGALLSASPELLLEFDGELARTRPIKGTAPRAAEAELDAARARALLASEKDRAELAMIVDLERNDLARVCEPRGVWVEGFPRLASYAHVHHLMADVVGRPRAGVDAFTLLEALFPGGSITGAPKLRAMQRIAELEGHGRGFFCGSLGFVDLRGRAAWNILIRTLVWRPTPAGSRAGELSFRVGGGITWASDAAAEERETLDKARGLIETLRS
jgi:para-aminobenzoate synthetase component 1